MTSHSAAIVKELEFSDLRLIKEKENGDKEIINVLPRELQYPSLNEVNYIAFGEATEEYHNELYAYIDYRKWKNEYIQGKSTRIYKKIDRDGHIKEERKILSEYIRNLIHHPENHENPKYSREELTESIELMRNFIKEHKETEA